MTGKRADFCPGVHGGKNWPPIAFSPNTRMIYIPANNNLCGSNMGTQPTYTPGRPFVGIGGSRPFIRPGATHVGEVQAWNVDTGQKVWTHIYDKSPNWGGMLVTAGGVVFTGGTSDRKFHAFDAAAGKLLWEFPTNSGILAPPTTFKVVYHLALGAFDGSTDYEKMSGGNWRPSNGHHSARHDFTVDIKDTEHPVTHGLKSFPVTTDELYANLRWQPEGSFHVLATAYDDHALYNGKARQPIPGAGINQPMLWTTQYGMGRVFVTTLGHGPDEVREAGFGTTFARGAEWAATGKVTLPVPPELAR